VSRLGRCRVCWADTLLSSPHHQGPSLLVCGVSMTVAPFWTWLGGSLTAATPCRSCCSAMAGGLPSLLAAAVSFSDTLVSRVPASSAVSPWQGALVSRSSAAWGALDKLRALVSRSPAFPAASSPLDPLAMGHLRCCFPSSCTAASLSRCRRVSAPSYPWTLELRLGRQAAIAWNAPGPASPSSLVKTGDQSVLKRLTPAFEAPLLSPPSGML
jgi:hypothetical protein